jgi:hypothetical protein
MKDKDKSKDQLVSELAALRQRVSELEASETGLGGAGDILGLGEGWHRRLINATYEGVWVIDKEGKPSTPTGGWPKCLAAPRKR